MPAVAFSLHATFFLLNFKGVFFEGFLTAHESVLFNLPLRELLLIGYFCRTEELIQHLDAALADADHDLFFFVRHMDRVKERFNSYASLLENVVQFGQALVR